MKFLKKSIIVSLILMLLCGVIYPLAMTGISQLVFHNKANGSIVSFNGKAVGSELLGQNFTDPRFFHGRVSSVKYNTYTDKDTKQDSNGATAYTGVASGSSNLAPSNKELQDRVQKDIEEFLKANPSVKKEDIPSDLFTSSGSGLDPDISPQAAAIQVPAVSKATGIAENELQAIIKKHTEGKTLGVFGEKRVNVLKVNLDIAKILKL